MLAIRTLLVRTNIVGLTKIPIRLTNEPGAYT
jgi:hypothetical protein